MSGEPLGSTREFSSHRYHNEEPSRFSTLRRAIARANIAVSSWRLLAPLFHLIGPFFWVAGRNSVAAALGKRRIVPRKCAGDARTRQLGSRTPQRGRRTARVDGQNRERESGFTGEGHEAESDDRCSASSNRQRPKLSFRYTSWNAPGAATIAARRSAVSRGNSPRSPKTT